MTALIIDDERLARVELRRLLSAHPEAQVIGEADNGEQALILIEELRPDVIFLDIQMPGMSGFDVLERLQEVPQIIFTTAFDQHAIRAFEVNALDYLLKPIAADRLAAAMSRVSSGRPDRRLLQVFVREGDRCWLVRLPDIRLLESEGNYARVYFGNERPLIRRSLNTLEQQLDKSMFFRANRRQILNLNCIARTSVGASGNLKAMLVSGIEVELSRRQSDRFRRLFSF